MHILLFAGGQLSSPVTHKRSFFSEFLTNRRVLTQRQVFYSGFGSPLLALINDRLSASLSISACAIRREQEALISGPWSNSDKITVPYLHLCIWQTLSSRVIFIVHIFRTHVPGKSNLWQNQTLQCTSWALEKACCFLQQQGVLLLSW